MIGRVIFDKTEHGSKKSSFYDQITKKLSLKISEQVEDRRKITIGGEYLTFHLPADEKSDVLDNWLNWNRLVEVGQLGRKEILETILMNRNNFTYSSKQYLYKYSRIIQWFPKSLFDRVDQLQPVGSSSTSYPKGLIFWPQKDEKLNIHLR